MTKLTLTRIFKGMKTTKWGDKMSVGIKCNEYGDKWLSTFKVTPEMDKWVEGDVVEVNVTENKGYLNFDTGAPQAGADHEQRIKRLENAVFGDSTAKETVVQLDSNNDEVKGKGTEDFDF